MTPPAATAATTALDVQLAAVPLPMTRLGCEVSTGRAAAGASAWPSGLPAAASRGARAGAGRPAGLRRLTGRGAWLGAAFGAGRLASLGVWLAGGGGAVTGLTPEDETPDDAARAAPGGCAAVPQAAMPRPAASAIVSPPRPLIIRTRPHASPAASDQVVIFHQMTDRPPLPAQPSPSEARHPDRANAAARSGAGDVKLHLMRVIWVDHAAPRLDASTPAGPAR